MQKIKNFLIKQQSIFIVVIALLLSLIAVGLLLVATNRNPFAAFYYFIRGGFGNPYNFADTITRMIPLAIAGVAFLVGAQTGVFNVGIEGQLLLGALVSALVGYAFKLPAVIHLPLTLLSGALVGGLYALIAAWLKAYRGINEILSTIMLNYPAFFFCHYLVVRVIPNQSVVPGTPFIQKTAELPYILAGTKLHAGLFVTFLVCFAAYWLLQKTTIGYEMRAVGKNKEAARYHGVPVEKRMVLSFFLSGAVAGLAGAVEMAALHHRYLDQFSPGYGYDAITVALLALLNPFGVLVTGTIFGALKTGIMDMSIYVQIPRQLSTFINGIVVLFIAGKNLIEPFYIRLVKGKEHYFDTVAKERK